MSAPSPQHQQRLDAAAYVLRLRDAGASVPVPGNPVAGLDGVFPLPIPPQSIRPQQAARIGIMETRDGAITDEQGAGPPTWDIGGQFLLRGMRAGTTTLDHYQAQRALEGFVRHYLEANRERALAREGLITMEWHDFYADEHWVVVPLAVPMGERDSARPLTERWSLRLRGLRRTTAAPRPPDPVTSALLRDPSADIRNTCPIELNAASPNLNAAALTGPPSGQGESPPDGIGFQ